MKNGDKDHDKRKDKAHGEAAKGQHAGPLAGEQNLPGSESFQDIAIPPVAALGASAGGLEALQVFFSNMPADSGIAFVVVQHLSPDFKSLMDELLSRQTPMAIHRVESGMALEPNSIYLIPPKKDMTLSQGRLLLEDRNIPRQFDLPIDIFLRSVALDAGERSVAVILSGTGSDGSRGITNIHDAGGLVIVQTPESAKFDGMPRSAIASGVVDLILPPDAIPDMIVQYFKDPISVRRIKDQDLLNVLEDNEGTAAVFALLKKQSGIDFAFYKPSTVGRRLMRRMAIKQLGTLSEYLALLHSDPDELNLLYKDLLIGVTSFFRDTKAFDVLETVAVPAIFKNATDRDEVRAWVAGCATGEEAYSVAILLVEGAEKAGFRGRVSVFATDVHRSSLDFASVGVYDTARLTNVSAERLARFFREESDGEYRVNPELRQRIVFAQHNVISDPPFTKMDLVTCRNLLIYLHPAAQNNALAMFHFSMKVGGVLFLGASESTGGISEELEVMDNKCKLFRKTRDVKMPLDFNLARRQSDSAQSAPPAFVSGVDRRLLHDYEALLQRHLPAGLLLNEQREVVHVFGEGGRFLTKLEGRMSRDVLEMVEGDLRMALGAALQRAATCREPVLFKRVKAPLKESGREQLTLLVDGIHDGRSKSCRFHVSFLLDSSSAPEPAVPEEALEESFAVSDAARRRIEALELELQSTRENLQATIEELQTTNEELQATNQEMLAANEELQSTNEELHSVNEELYTVNAEFEKKNKELLELNEDYDNLLRSTEVGTLFLDSQLRIRRFNPSIDLGFKLLPQDIGRPVDHIAYKFEGQADLLADLSAVLADGSIVEKELTTGDGGWILKRVLPFYASDQTRKGVVITFTDITKVKQMEMERLRDQNLRTLASSVPGAVFQYAEAGGGKFTFVSEGVKSVFGLDPDAVMENAHEFWTRLGATPHDWKMEHSPDDDGDRETIEIEHEIALPGGARRWIHTRCSPAEESGQKVWNGVSLDITKRRRNEERLSRTAGWQRRMLDHAPVLIWQAGVDAKCNWFNQTWLEFTGRTMEQETGDGWTEGVHPEDMARCISIYKESFENRNPFSMDYRLRRSDGQYRWITDQGTPVQDLDGKFAGYIGYCFDITERAETEEGMRQAVEMMANANKIKSAFLANMSHEIRTPLNGMLGMLQVLALTPLNEEQQEFVNNSLLSGKNLMGIINDILDLSKIEAGKMELTEEPFDLKAVLDLGLKSFSAIARQKGVTLQIEYVTDIPKTIIGDAIRLNQIYFNLVGNALKFTPSGKIHITVSMEPDNSHPDRLLGRLCVEDTGVGIPSDKIDQIFKPFVQAGGGVSENVTGTGLGLTISRSLALLMGGDISISSEENRGAKVCCDFVVKRHRESKQTLPSAGQSAKNAAKRSLFVLVVEDDKVNRKVIQQLLEKGGHRVVLLDGEDDVLGAITEHDFDIILMDIRLNGASGVEIATAIRQDKKLGQKSGIPIIALTAFAMQGDKERFIKAGMDAYLAKPFEWGDLEKMMYSLTA